MIVRNLIEFIAIIAVWGGFQHVLGRDLPHAAALPVAILLSLAKTSFFGVENIRQLFEATRSNQPYHRFMLLMLINMTQIILSFGLDFHCLHSINSSSFSVDLQDATPFETMFEFVYYSTLNFTFFGYGDVTPQTVPAKFVTMTEILLAFVTVIFLLSDFISLKESLGKPSEAPTGNASPNVRRG
jgi:hypothetical protein